MDGKINARIQKERNSPDLHEITMRYQSKNLLVILCLLSIVLYKKMINIYLSLKI